MAIEPFIDPQERTDRLLFSRRRTDRVSLLPGSQSFLPSLLALLRERESDERLGVARIRRGEFGKNAFGLGDAARLQFELAGAPFVIGLMRRIEPLQLLEMNDRCGAARIGGAE